MAFGSSRSEKTPAVVALPMFPLPPSVNHSWPSTPRAMAVTTLSWLGTVNSVTTPAGVMRPTRPTLTSVNQTLPSGPAVMVAGPVPEVSADSVMTPTGVTRWTAPAALTQKFPSGPAVIELMPVGAGTSEMLPWPWGKSMLTAARPENPGGRNFRDTTTGGLAATM